jgi:hypothetical protein
MAEPEVKAGSGSGYKDDARETARSPTRGTSGGGVGWRVVTSFAGSSLHLV